MNTPASAASLGALTSLRPSPRLPVLFLGHGSPMNALGGNDYYQAWQALGSQFGQRYPKPQLILCISAHWLTHGWQLTAMAQPRTIHDFGGFPGELYEQQYPAPGAPVAAQEISLALPEPPLGLDKHQWGLDHGAWAVLKPMFPAADIPVVQLSMDYSRPPAEHLALGQQLQGLRERGVLIVGSGNIVHNLRVMQAGASAKQAYDWALAFDQYVTEQVQRSDLAALADFQKLGRTAQMAHPTWEHYLPLLYAAGAAAPKDRVAFFNASFQAASISMRSVIWS